MVFFFFRCVRRYVLSVLDGYYIHRVLFDLIIVKFSLKKNSHCTQRTLIGFLQSRYSSYGVVDGEVGMLVWCFGDEIVLLEI